MNNIFSESTSQILRSGRMKTSSAIYRTWLSVFKGYTVEKTIQSPKGYSMGRLIYKKSWIMRPKETEND